MSDPLCDNRNKNIMNTSFTNVAPNPEPGTLNSEPQTNYPEPPAELIADIRNRLTELPREAITRFHHALTGDSIDTAGRILYWAGVCLCSRELYEYRKTLFPPNTLVDPYTAGPPILREVSIAPINSIGPIGPISPIIPNAPTESEPPSEPGTTDAPHVTHLTDVTHLTHATHLTYVTDVTSPPARDNRSLMTDNGLLSDLRSILSRYVVLPEMAAEALALWIVHTYAFTLRQVTTYIGVVSPEKRCGKTTLLELLGLLANRSLTASNISPSALFRVIEETQPTLLIDEADTFLQGRDELAGILNAGYRKNNSYVVRVADRRKVGRGVPAEPEFAQWSTDPIDSPTQPSAINACGTEFAKYSCWCPKVMAAIGRLPDTLADRCIVITMQRKTPAEKCERMRQLNAIDLRKRCAEFVRGHSDKIAHAQPDIPSTLNDRAADIWEPLFAIADLAGGEWPQLAREAAQKLSASDDDLTLIGYFLKDLRNLMIIKSVDRMLSREIVSALNPMHDRPWEDLRRGREINEWWLAWQLRQLGIRTRTMRAGDAMGKGYTLADIEAAFRRYVPNAESHLSQPVASLKHEMPNLKSSNDDPSLKYEISNVKSPENDADLDRLLKQLLSTLPRESP